MNHKSEMYLVLGSVTPWRLHCLGRSWGAEVWRSGRVMDHDWGRPHGHRLESLDWVHGKRQGT